ncbi:MAG: hypothetical protein U5K27_12825 [Desulfotignum sp.]|nr:hypothetical protein [Desulfotignum sp.]
MRIITQVTGNVKSAAFFSKKETGEDLPGAVREPLPGKSMPELLSGMDP